MSSLEIISIILNIILIAALVIVVVFLLRKKDKVQTVVTAISNSPSVEKLKKMKLLWSEHVYLTHIFIENAAQHYPALPYVVQMLMKNQEEIGQNFGDLLGNKSKGKHLTELLKEHIKLAGEIVEHKPHYHRHVKEWYENAQKIADYLAANVAPGKDGVRKKLRDNMRAHLDTTLDEARAILERKYNKIYPNFQAAHSEVMKMIDYIQSL